MDLRKYHPSLEQISELKNYLGYQPYIITDEWQTGIADDWIHRSGVKSMEKSKYSDEDWARFTDSNGRLRKMYNDWIDQICDVAGDMSAMKVIDTASNNGFFLYRFLEKGAHDVLGYDQNEKCVPLMKILNEVTKFNARFECIKYDEMKHEFPKSETSDIVISSAIMCHLSDPLYYLNFLSSITKKILFLFSSIDDNNNFRITYRQPGKFYNRKFPICFDNMTTVSWPLIEFGLKELGFKEIHVLDYQKDWIPWESYKQYKTIIAVR